MCPSPYCTYRFLRVQYPYLAYDHLLPNPFQSISHLVILWATDYIERMAEDRLPKIALKWMPKQKRARERPKKSWMEGIKKAMNERNLNEGQWEDRKQWSLGVGQRRKTFWTRYTGCPGRNVPEFGRMFLKLKYTDITQNTYIRSWTVIEIKAREKCGLLAVPRTVPGSRDILPVHCPCPSLYTAGSSAFTLRLHK